MTQGMQKLLKLCSTALLSRFHSIVKLQVLFKSRLNEITLNFVFYFVKVKQYCEALTKVKNDMC